MLYHNSHIELAKKGKQTSFNKKIFDDAISWLYNEKNFTPEQLTHQQAQNLANEIYSHLVKAVKTGITDAKLKYELSETVTKALNYNVFVFSQLKAHHELQEASQLLTDANGAIKPFDKFKTDVQKIHANYNVRYLEAEYGFAVHSAQMAAKWKDFEEDGDLFNLQYRTAADEKVRESHERLQNTTLPTSDPFWNSFMPPLGWGCRCTVVQVRKQKYETTDPAIAHANGITATTTIGKDGKNKAEMFRFNPGKTLTIIPPNHPYYKVSEQVKNTIAQIVPPNSIIDRPVKTVDDFNAVVKNFANQNPQMFAQGFKEVKVLTTGTDNANTNMKGTIWLRDSRFKLSMEAFENIRTGKPTTLHQEDALSTLWHEINHNANRKGFMILSKTQIKRMELANEFVSRKTLPEFMAKLGGELQNKELVNNRNTTPYNNWVVKYDKLIEKTGAKPGGVLESVKNHLFTHPYTNQTEGLIDAVYKRLPQTAINNAKIKKAVINCTKDNLSVQNFENWLNENFK